MMFLKTASILFAICLCSLMKASHRLPFDIDIKTCEACGGPVKVIACIDEPEAINKILAHLQREPSNQAMLPVNRAPPGVQLFHKYRSKKVKNFDAG